MEWDAAVIQIEDWLNTSVPPENLRALLGDVLWILKDYPKVIESARREASGRVRVHMALAEAIGGEAASRINDSDTGSSGG